MTPDKATGKPTWPTKEQIAAMPDAEVNDFLASRGLDVRVGAVSGARPHTLPTSESVPVLSALLRARVTAFAAFIVKEHPPRPSIDEIGPDDRIYDWACAECITGYHDARPIPGFRCIPHQAAAALEDRTGV
jgi:hypothetical protein